MEVPGNDVEEQSLLELDEAARKGNLLLPRRAWKAALLLASLAAAGAVLVLHPLSGAGRAPAEGASDLRASLELAEDPEADSDSEGETQQEAMSIHSNYSSLNDSYVSDPDPKESLEANSMKAFKHFAKKVLLANELTPEEMQAFKRRVVAKMKRLLHKGVSIQQVKHKAWKKMIKLALNSQKPVLTDRMVQRINKARLGWKARKVAAAANISMDTMRQYLGLHPDFGKHLAYVKLNRDGTMQKVVDAIVEKPHKTEVPKEFDASKKWPRCAEVFNHKRDQGQCANCWAQATASLLESHRCIYSEGAFSGATAWFSAGYVASCYQMPGKGGGCDSGDPSYSLQMAIQLGVPTGGGIHALQTCVPYWGSGDSLKHTDLSDNIEAPTCPTMCTSNEYPKVLDSDKFLGTPNLVGMNMVNDARTAQMMLMEGGPVMMAMTIYTDLMAYSSGYYTPMPDAQPDMGHAVVLLGWSHYEGKLFWDALNWWRLDSSNWWGQDGHFKIDADCCTIAYIGLQYSEVPTGAQQPLNASDA